MAKRFKLYEGDLFKIPVKDDLVSIGQIVEIGAINSVFIMCVFNLIQNKNESIIISEVVKSEILFLCNSNDAKLYHKDWEIIGNYKDNLKDIKMPYFRLGLSNDNAYIVNHLGKRLLPISEEIFDMLNYKTEVGPIRFENALRAYYGYDEWIDDNYNIILYSNTLKSIEIAKSLGIDVDSL